MSPLMKAFTMLISRKISGLIRQCENASPYIADTVIAVASGAIVVVSVLERSQLAWASLLCALGMSAALVWRRQVPGGVALVCGVLLWMDAALTGTALLPLAGLIAVGSVAGLSNLRPRWAMHAGAAAVVVATWVSADMTATQLWLTVFSYVGAYGCGRWWASRQEVEAVRRSGQGLVSQRDVALQQRRQVADRARIALDIQDLAFQPLDLLVLQADVGRDLVTSDRDGAVQSFDSIAVLGRRASTQLRRIRDLLAQAARREDGDIVERDLNDLALLVEHLRAAGLEMELDMQAQDEKLGLLPLGAESVIYETVREVLAGVVRHSDMRSVRISVTSADDGVTVVVTAGGAGRTKPRPAGRDGELAALQRRAAEFGGTIETESPSGERGTRWLVTFPFRDASTKASV